MLKKLREWLTKQEKPVEQAVIYNRFVLSDSLIAKIRAGSPKAIIHKKGKMYAKYDSLCMTRLKGDSLVIDFMYKGSVIGSINMLDARLFVGDTINMSGFDAMHEIILHKL